MSEVRLIDANALKETAMVKFGDDITSITLFKIFEELIDNAPTVEYTFKEAFQKTVCENRLYCPARPQGEWIRTGSLGNGNAQYECSNCHYGDEQAESQEVPYCWHCGAKMKKGGAE